MKRNNLNHGVISGRVCPSREWKLRILLILVLVGIHGTLRPPLAQANTQSLTLSGNGRYFLQGSTPFFWLGDTGWLLFSNASLAGSPNSEVDQYLQDRKNRGFTVIQSFLVYWQPMEPNRQGHVPFFNNDMGQPTRLTSMMWRRSSTKPRHSDCRWRLDRPLLVVLSLTLTMAPPITMEVTLRGDLDSKQTLSGCSAATGTPMSRSARSAPWPMAFERPISRTR
jgi:Protein of unknown function (DUF4038)